MKNRTVQTFDGNNALRTECRFIKGAFYKMNSQCFRIEDGQGKQKWYRINSPLIVYDHYKNEYTLKNSNLENGIVGFENGEPKIGYFTRNAGDNVITNINGSIFTVMSDQVFEGTDYKECVFGKEEMFLSKSYRASMGRLPKVVPYKSFDRLPYSCRDIIGKVSSEFNTSYSPLKPLRDYSKYSVGCETVPGTFGVEFETETGRIPRRHLSKIGLMPLRDGSINGDEYVTIPYSFTSRDLKALEDVCDKLTEFTSFSRNNSLHVHMRIRKFSKKFFIGAFITNKLLESEIFSLFPRYYKCTSKFKASGRDYNNPLPGISSIHSTKDIGAIFSYLYKLYSGGLSYTELGSSTSVGHPSDSSGDHKWNVGVRYIAINFVPLLFNGFNTIEYRLHPPTTNYHKVLAWLYIINAILKYSEKVGDEISKLETTLGEYLKTKKITLDLVINDIYSKSSAQYALSMKYIKYRKDLRKKLDGEEDYYGKYELKNDNEFVS